MMLILVYVLLLSMFISISKSYRCIPKHHISLNTIRNIRNKNTPSTFASWLGLGRNIEEIDPGNVKGTKLKILKYPNPLLRANNDDVVVIDETIKQIAREMLLVMYASEGIGLAAPQVGKNIKLMVFNEYGDANKKESEMILINPKILDKSPGTDLKEEGCLSFPQIYGKVHRHEWVDVEYNNENGEKITKRITGFPARIFQHEYDHLDKVLFIDRLIDEDKNINQKRLDKIIKKYGPGGAI